MSISRELSKFIEPGGSLSYDNTTSGLSATTIKSAIDELNTLLGGGNIGSQATFEVYDFTATAAQTTFSLSSNHGKGSNIAAPDLIEGTVYIITDLGDTDFTLIGASSNTVGITFTKTATVGLGTGTAKVVATYVPGYIQVYVNGVFLSETDYVASDGDNVVLDTGADVGALVTVVTLDSFNTATQLRVLNVDAGAPDNSVSINSSGNLVLPDDGRAIFGAGSDLQIYHNGSDSFITDNGTGDLKISGEAQIKLGNVAGEFYATFNNNLSVNLYYDNVLKFATTATGVDVTGTANADKITTDSNVDAASFTSTGSTYVDLNNGTVTGRIQTISSDFFIGTATTGCSLAFKSGNNVEAMRIDSSGNVGIGRTPDVNGVLQLNVATGLNTNLTFAENSVNKWMIGSLTSSNALRFYDLANSREAMRIDASGFVGIGTSSPTAALNVKNIIDIDTNAASGTGVFRLQGGVSTYSGYIGFDASTMSIGTNNASRGLSFAAGGSEAMRIDASGRVGIGTSSPAAAKFSSTPDGVLNLSGDKPVVYLTEEDETDSNVWMGLSNEVGIIGNTGVGLAFRTGASTATEAMRIDSSGRLLINKTSSTGSLSLESQAPSGFSVGSGFYSAVTQSTIEFQDTNTTANYKVRIGSETDDLLMFAGGSERMRIDANGDVSIGDTSTEGAKLHIRTSNATTYNPASASGADGVNLIVHNDNATANTTAGIILRTQVSGSFADARINNIGVSQNNSAMTFHTEGSGTVAERMRIDPDGNVGIGTDSPDGQFESAHTDTSTYSSSTIKNDFIISRKNSSNVANQSVGLQFDVTGWSGSTTGVAGITAIQPSNASSADLAFTLRKDGTYAERMRIDSRGVLGVNAVPEAWDSAFSSVMQVGAMSVLTSGGDNGRVFSNAYYDGGSTYKRINTGYAHSYEQTSGTHRWYIGSGGSAAADSTFTWDESMRIDASGNVGINATTIAANGLQIGNTSSTDTEQLFLYSNKAIFSINTDGATNAAGTTIAYSWANGGQGPLKFDNATSTVMTLDASGNLLVGADANAIGNAGFKISGVGFARVERTGTTSQSHLSFTNGNGDVGSISTSDSATTYNTSSDQRLKDNIVDAPSASDDIDAIQVRSFDWKVNGSHQKYGMVAQELVTVAPEAVHQPEDPEEMMGVDYSKLVPMMLKEIQSLRARVAQLES